VTYSHQSHKAGRPSWGCALQTPEPVGKPAVPGRGSPHTSASCPPRTPNTNRTRKGPAKAAAATYLTPLPRLAEDLQGARESGGRYLSGVRTAKVVTSAFLADVRTAPARCPTAAARPSFTRGLGVWRLSSPKTSPGTPGQTVSVVYKRQSPGGTGGGLWWRYGDSNPRPSECHSDALPTELYPQTVRANG